MEGREKKPSFWKDSRVGDRKRDLDEEVESGNKDRMRGESSLNEADEF